MLLYALMIPFFCATNTLPSGANSTFVGVVRPLKTTWSRKPEGNVMTAALAGGSGMKKSRQGSSGNSMAASAVRVVRRRSSTPSSRGSGGKSVMTGGHLTRRDRGSPYSTGEVTGHLEHEPDTPDYPQHPGLPGAGLN